MVNNKIYIGKTTKSLERRFAEHISEAKRYQKCILEDIDFGYTSKLYPAMIKYGTDNFKIELLARFDASVDLELKEIEFIDNYSSCNDEVGYNISPGGLGGPLFKGHKHSDKTKQLISLIHKGKKQSTEFIKKRTYMRRKTYQNLNTGEIFHGLADANRAYPKGSVSYGVLSEGKVDGNFWTSLDDEHQSGYDELERLSIIEEREQRLFERRSSATIKANKNISIQRKNEIIKKRVATYKETVAKRTQEQRDEINMKLSAMRKGKKHSPESIDKLKNYYKTADAETLSLRNKRNGDGQRGKTRYENIKTGKHKMFVLGQQPEGWIKVAQQPKPVGKRKYKHKVTGEIKMFFPEYVDLALWEKVVK